MRWRIRSRPRAFFVLDIPGLLLFLVSCLGGLGGLQPAFTSNVRTVRDEALRSLHERSEEFPLKALSLGRKGPSHSTRLTGYVHYPPSNFGQAPGDIQASSSALGTREVSTLPTCIVSVAHDSNLTSHHATRKPGNDDRPLRYKRQCPSGIK